MNSFAVSRRSLVAGSAGFLIAAAAPRGGPLVIPDVKSLPWQDVEGVRRRTLRDGAYVFKIAAGASWRPAGIVDAFIVRGVVRHDETTLMRFSYVRTDGAVTAVEDAALLVCEGGLGDRQTLSTWDIPWAYSRGWNRWPGHDDDKPEQAGAPPIPARPTTIVKGMTDTVRLIGLLAAPAMADVGFASSADADCFVLQGSGAFGDAGGLQAGGYAHFKAGEPIGPWFSARGAVVLLRFANSPTARPISAHVPRADDLRSNDAWSAAV